jgi:hypothetical protein
VWINRHLREEPHGVPELPAQGPLRTVDPHRITAEFCLRLSDRLEHLAKFDVQARIHG